MSHDINDLIMQFMILGLTELTVCVFVCITRLQNFMSSGEMKQTVCVFKVFFRTGLTQETVCFWQ